MIPASLTLLLLALQLIVNTRCVRRMGTHYVTELKRDGGGDACFNIYHPRGSKETRLKINRPIAAEQQATCVAPLHLNHYAVKSREDYLQKFQRGRISRGEKDVKVRPGRRKGASTPARMRSQTKAHHSKSPE